MLKYQVGKVYYDFDKSCDETILKTFNNEKNAIEYIVELYINELLENNNFSNTKSNYYYRKKCDDMYSEWKSFNINDLQNYCKLNNKEEIKKYLCDYNLYKNKRI